MASSLAQAEGVRGVVRGCQYRRRAACLGPPDPLLSYAAVPGLPTCLQGQRQRGADLHPGPQRRAPAGARHALPVGRRHRPRRHPAGIQQQSAAQEGGGSPHGAPPGGGAWLAAAVVVCPLWDQVGVHRWPPRPRPAKLVSHLATNHPIVPPLQAVKLAAEEVVTLTGTVTNGGCPAAGAHTAPRIDPLPASAAAHPAVWLVPSALRCCNAATCCNL